MPTQPTRGILYPTRLPTLHREPVEGPLADFVRWFWIPEWDLAPGRTSRQHLIGYPACNLVVENTMVGLSGPSTRASHRDLVGRGWAVGALLRPAAIRTFTDEPASLRDQYRTLEHPDLLAAVSRAMDADAPDAARHADATAVLGAWLGARLGEPSEEGLLANRLVDATEHPTLLTAADLAKHLHVSTRTLQRLAAKYVGLSPVALIRRRRLQEAAERLRNDAALNLATLAHELGYADHAHLCADFRDTLGFTPSAYRRGRPAAAQPASGA